MNFKDYLLMIKFVPLLKFLFDEKQNLIEIPCNDNKIIITKNNFDSLTYTELHILMCLYSIGYNYDYLDTDKRLNIIGVKEISYYNIITLLRGEAPKNNKRYTTKQYQMINDILIKLKSLSINIMIDDKEGNTPLIDFNMIDDTKQSNIIQLKECLFLKFLCKFNLLKAVNRYFYNILDLRKNMLELNLELLYAIATKCSIQGYNSSRFNNSIKLSSIKSYKNDKNKSRIIKNISLILELCKELNIIKNYSLQKEKIVLNMFDKHLGSGFLENLKNKGYPSSLFVKLSKLK